MRKIVLMALAAVGLVALMIQMDLNRRKMAEALKEDEKRWKEKQEAVRSQPGTGQATGTGGEVLWDNMLAGEKDDEPLDNLAEDKGYKYLIRHLANMKAEETLGPGTKFDYVELLKNPAQNRGKVVSLSGLINKVYSNIRLESNQGPYDAVYRLYLVDLSGTEGFVLDVLDRPDGIDRRDPVASEGIFLRTLKYENEKGQAVRVPVFVAKSIRKLPRGTVHRTWSTEMIVGAVTVSVILVGIIVIAGRQPKARTQKQTPSPTSISGAQP